MMMSALMLEPVLKPAMLEHVIASVLEKLNANGEVSHEEGLGGQAIREHAAQYNHLMADYFQHEKRDDEAADRILDKAEKLLTNLQKVTENYHMVDDDFQLAVLTARYLTSTAVSDDRKRDFLQSAINANEKTPRITLLLENFRYIAKVTRPYVENPVAVNLVSFGNWDDGGWRPGSWRDSSTGYANGRFAMDVNAVWAPNALEAIRNIFTFFGELDIALDDHASTPTVSDTPLADYIQNPENLDQAIKT